MILEAAFIMATMNDNHIKIEWKEKKNKILPLSVCYNYKKGSIDYGMCKKKAIRIFKKKCKNKEGKKFCVAARKVNPMK